jgi:hypothetical protein
MKTSHITKAAAMLIVLSGVAGAQTSTQRIPIHKDVPSARTTTSTGEVTSPMPATMPSDTLLGTDTLYNGWYTATGSTCSTVDVNAARAVQIKTDLYNPSTMISPDSAKVIALCAVPGQIGSGEMNVADGRTEYAIDIIPNKKKTHTKVIVDAQTGSVLSSKQFGGLRGLAGWVRESAEHKKNAKP